MMAFGGVIGTGVPPLVAAVGAPAAAMAAMAIGLLVVTGLVILLARRGVRR
jgi:hypothetical protein